MTELGPDNAIWDDGEWVSWDSINAQIDEQHLRERYPGADLSLVSVFVSLVDLAREYHELTGRHLQVYGDIGELYCQIVYGLQPHRIYAKGSDGKIGNDFVEVKTIAPFKSNRVIALNLDRNFSKILIVKVDANFEIVAKLVDRKSLPKCKGPHLRLDWDDVQDTARA
jgi:hypothetical protein